MNNADSKLEARRNLLKLGAVSLPMVVTAKASAQTVLHSTTCTIMPPSFFVIYADGAGTGYYLEVSDLGEIDSIQNMTEEDAIALLQTGMVFPTNVGEGFYYSNDIAPFTAQEFGNATIDSGQQAYWDVVYSGLGGQINLPGMSCVASFTTYGQGL